MIAFAPKNNPWANVLNLPDQFSGPITPNNPPLPNEIIGTQFVRSTFNPTTSVFLTLNLGAITATGSSRYSMPNLVSDLKYAKEYYAAHPTYYNINWYFLNAYLILNGTPGTVKNIYFSDELPEGPEL